MRNKPKHNSFRALALVLVLCLACLPLMGMAASGEDGGDIDSGEPEIVLIDIVPEETPEPEIVLLDAAPEETEPPATEPEATPESSEQPETPEETPPQETPAPVCVCEVKCHAEAPNAACPVCSADVNGCTGHEPTPAPVCVCETKCSADAHNAACPVCSADVNGCTGHEPTPAPVCVCETKCSTDAPNAACPVCAADAAKCQGEAPDPDFTIRILRPDGWYTDRAFVTIRVMDENKTGWEKVEVKIEKNGSWTDLTDELAEREKAEVEISENCTLYVTVTDKDGKAHSKSAYIECFDREAPTLRAGIDGELLRVEASDDLSGVAYIYVNGYRFTGMVNGTLDINLKSYADEYEQMSVVAVDYAGNKSKTVQVKNPYYGADDDGDEDGHDGYCSDDCDCRDTETPTTTPTPTTPTVTTPVTTPTTNKGSGGGQASAPTTTAAPDSDDEDDKADAPVTLEPGTGFSENGNAVTRDLLYDKYTNKQFITVQDRDGNTFYIVIDYDSPLNEEEEQYQTYFLNLVDVADLAALAEDSGEEATCSCADKCVVGAINTSCPVCASNMSECAGVEAAPDTTPEPDTDPDADDEPEEESGGGPALIIIVLLLLAGGGALYFLKFRKKKPDARGPADLDDYDYGEDEDDEEYETEDDAEEAAAGDAEDESL